jgi:LmbE family N-acetylglucosaminyl deacetylase
MRATTSRLASLLRLSLLAALPALCGPGAAPAGPAPAAPSEVPLAILADVNLGPAPLEPPATGGVATLDRALAKLSAHQRLLVIGAHPDDEDTSLLALISRGMGGEAAYFSLSRGEGGQNLIGPELGVGLGLIRSRELLAARAVDGGRQFFARTYDFGYTRSLDRTLGKWPKDVLLEDAVRVIRRFKPQAVVSIFPAAPDPTNHGQHQAAGATAYAAFPLAGDPAALPQLRAEGLAPWTPQALYQSIWSERDPATVVLPIGGIDPFTGKSIYQLALASRGMHRSQGMGRLQTLGPQERRMARVSGGEAAPGKELFAGIDTHLRAIAAPIAGAARRQRAAAELDAAEAIAVRTRRALNPDRPGEAVGGLAEIVRHLRAARAVLDEGGIQPAELPAAELIDEKLAVAEIGAAAAAGIAIDATTEREALIPGESFPVRATLWNSGGPPLAGAAVSLVPAPEWRGEAVAGERQALAAGKLASWDLTATVPAAAPATMPYFLRRPLVRSLYDWSAAAPAERGEPFGPPPLTALFSFTLDGVPIALRREVVHLHRDEVLGEVRRPLRVVPRLEVAVAEPMQVWPLDRREDRSLRLILTSHARAPLRGRLEAAPAGAAADGAFPAVTAQAFELPAADDDAGKQAAATLTLHPPAAAGRYPLTVAAVLDGGERFDLAVPLIDYPHIPPTPNPRRAEVEISAADIRLPPLRRVGYVRGAADRVPEFLSQVGFPVELLDPAALADGAGGTGGAGGAEGAGGAGPGLARFDAIVVGSRAYESDPALGRANRLLLDYVRAGGLLIVQYQQYPFVTGGFAPYKIEIARPHDRVTDETAPVKVLDPANPVFTTPNRIGDADWQGWVQERGLYFAHGWDPAYKPLLAMADPGGPEQRGALLVAALGKGTYVYTGLAFFRQLPAGVPGAWRLFANLLALARTARQP